MLVELNDLEHKDKHIRVTLDLHRVYGYKEWYGLYYKGTLIYLSNGTNVTTTMSYSDFDDLYKRWLTSDEYKDFERWPDTRSRGWGADGDEGFGI